LGKALPGTPLPALRHGRSSGTSLPNKCAEYGSTADTPVPFALLGQTKIAGIERLGQRSLGIVGGVEIVPV